MSCSHLFLNFHQYYVCTNLSNGESKPHHSLAGPWINADPSIKMHLGIGVQVDPMELTQKLQPFMEVTLSCDFENEETLKLDTVNLVDIVNLG